MTDIRRLAEYLKTNGFYSEYNYLLKLAQEQLQLFEEVREETEEGRPEVVPEMSEAGPRPTSQEVYIPEDQRKMRNRLLQVLMRSHPDRSKEELAQEVMSIPADHTEFLVTIKEYRDRYPELKAQIPSYNLEQAQTSIPDMPPEIRILPDPRRLEEERAALEDEWTEKRKLYREKLEEFIAEKGRNPSNYEKMNIPGYDYVEEGNYRYRQKLKPENIQVDYNIDREEYRKMVGELYSKYLSISQKRTQIITILDDIKISQAASEPLPPESMNFKGYDEMVEDLSNRLYHQIYKIVIDSVGISIFGASTGRGDDWSRLGLKGFFDNLEEGWFDNPALMKEYLEEAPSFKNEVAVNVYSYSISQKSTISYWFSRKYNNLDSYDDSLDRTLASVKRGQRFLKGFKKKLNKVLKSKSGARARIANSVIKHMQDEIHEKYLLFASEIEKEKDIATGYSYYHNQSGFYKTDSYRRSDEENLKKFNLISILHGKHTQISIIENFAYLISDIFNSVVSDVTKRILQPARDQASKIIIDEVIREATGYSVEDLRGSNISPEVAKSLVSNWTKFDPENRILYISALNYPKFLFKDKTLSGDMMSTSSQILGEKIVDTITGSLSSLDDNFNIELEKLIKRGYITIKSRDIADITTHILSKKKFLKPRLITVLKKKMVFASVRELPYRDSKEEMNQVTALEERYSSVTNLVSHNYFSKERLISDFLDGNINEEEETRYNRFNNEIKDFDRWMASGFRNVRRYDKPRHLEKIHKNIKSSLVNIINKRNENRGTSIFNKDYFSRQPFRGEDLEGLIKTTSELELLPEQYPDESIQAVIDKELEYAFGEEDKKRRTNEILGKVRQEIERNIRFNKELTFIKNSLPNLAQELRLMHAEVNYRLLAKKRGQIFKAVGPRTILKKFKALEGKPWLEGIPISVWAKEMIKGKAKEMEYPSKISDMTELYPIDDVSEFYREVSKKPRDMPPMFYAKLVTAKVLGITSYNNFIEMGNVLDQTWRAAEGNIGYEEVKTYFPDTLISVPGNFKKKISAAIRMAAFVHNRGEGLPKSFFANMLKSQNFKNWGKIHLVGRYFEACAQLKRLGGYRKIMETIYPVAKIMVEQGYIKRGFGARVKKLITLCNNPPKLVPGQPDFEENKRFIETALSDLKSVQEFGEYSEYNEETEIKSPDIHKIDWAPIGQKFRFRTLRTYDSLHFSIGLETSCCQHINGVGKNAAIDSYVNPLAGVLILEINTEVGWKIASQSYFHYVQSDHGYILDNVEASLYGRGAEYHIGYSMDDMYAAWATHVESKLRAKYVLCGKRFTKLDPDRFKKKSLRCDPRDFVYEYKYQGRTDWSPRSSIDLTTPKFKQKIKIKKKKAKISRSERIYRLSVIVDNNMLGITL